MHLFAGFALIGALPAVLLGQNTSVWQDKNQVHGKASAPTVTPVIEFSQLIVKHRPTPAPYPALARLAGVEGTVLLDLTVSATGVVETAEPIEGPGLLRPTAEYALKRWTFEPIQVQGVPTRVRTQLHVPFTLSSHTSTEVKPPINKVVVELEESPGLRSIPLDLETYRRAVSEWLHGLSMQVVPTTEAKHDRALYLKFQIETIRDQNGAFIFSLLGRFSQWVDRYLRENEPGKTPKVFFLHRIIGQRSENGFPDAILGSLRGQLQSMLIWPVSSIPPTDGRGTMPPASLDPLYKEFEKFAPMHVDFEKIKVKHQPPAPPYPEGARSRGISGTVVVEITVDSTGTPVWAEVKSGPPELMLTALSYALQWQFEPALINGKPQYARFRLTMPFRLQIGFSSRERWDQKKTK